MTEFFPKPSQEQDDAFPDNSLDELARTQPSDTLRASQNDEQDRLHSRRSFLKFAGKAVAVTGLGMAGGMQALHLDTRIGEMINPFSKLQLEHIAEARTPEVARSATLLIPGFNVASAVPAAHAVKDTVSQYGNVLALTHAGDRFSIDDLADYTRHYIAENDILSLTLVGSSLGGVISVELASRVKEVDLVIADSSPADPSDALSLPEGFLDALAENVSWALDTLDLSGGPAVRTGIEFVKRLHDGDKNTLTCLQEALAQDYTKSCPNPLVLDLYIFMMTHNIQSHKELPSSVAVAYLGVEDTHRDLIVNQGNAMKKYSQFCLDRDAPFTHVTSNGTGHADITAHGNEYAGMYKTATKAIADQRRARLHRSMGGMGYRILGR